MMLISLPALLVGAVLILGMWLLHRHEQRPGGES